MTTEIHLASSSSAFQEYLLMNYFLGKGSNAGFTNPSLINKRSRNGSVDGMMQLDIAKKDRGLICAADDREGLYPSLRDTSDQPSTKGKTGPGPGAYDELID
ncbi:uncharacterized protein LOC143215961 [Lasioglossum baleicum]|uniref:uncharacterized protein LOC143215961 n=1 Tax=Lasioglossum baleicum TaxID=434251 RepID=UPI003FCD7ABE